MVPEEYDDGTFETDFGGVPLADIDDETWRRTIDSLSRQAKIDREKQERIRREIAVANGIRDAAFPPAPPEAIIPDMLSGMKLQCDEEDYPEDGQVFDDELYIQTHGEVSIFNDVEKKHTEEIPTEISYMLFLDVSGS